MLIFDNDRIAVPAGERIQDYDRPYQPGDVYLTKFFNLPYVTTILDCTDSTVTTSIGVESMKLFNLRAVCYLGRRARINTIWLPWAVLRPTRLVVNNETLSLATDSRFWCITAEDLQRAGIDPKGPLHSPQLSSQI